MRFLLDENLEHEVFYRLRNEGHDVRHIDLSDRFDKGDADADLAAFSREHEFVIVTHDDFRDAVSEDESHAVLYLPDQTLSARDIAVALHRISVYYRQSELRGFLTVSESWLSSSALPRPHPT